MTLELERLTKTFPGGVQAVDEVSLVVPEGALVVLVGPSGCGKTTLLRLVAGLEAPTSGRIVLAGRDLTRVAPADREVAMVFQDHALYPSRTVGENLAFPLRMRRRPAAEIERVVRAAAARLGLQGVLSVRPGELSGGQRQRVALGRALVRRPALFLFDEPLSNIDAGLRRQLRQLIKQLQRESAILTLHVTHDQEEALALADLLVVMNAGRILQAGSPQEVYERPANRFVAGFVGPAMNFVEGWVSADDRGVLFEGLFGAVEVGPMLAPWVGQTVTLGFRPEVAQLRRAHSGASQSLSPSHAAQSQPQCVAGAESSTPRSAHSGASQSLSPSHALPLILRGRVLLVEYLGDRIDVTLQGPQMPWTVRLERGQVLQLGDEVELMVPLERCRWFASGPTGKALDTSPTSPA